MKPPPPFKPGSADEIAAFLRERSHAGAPVTLRGGGSKSGFGRPAHEGEAALDLSGLSGVTLYQPDELVLTAQAGTKLADIIEMIGKHGQCLAFEPPEFGALFGNGKSSTLGGVVASGWSGPRRVKAGAVRDHVLGAIAIGGDGALFKSGGRVVKNVTGFDLPKLLTGSHGTLAAMTEITIKVVPAPEVSHTIVALGFDSPAGIRLLSDVLGGPYEVSGAAHLPAAITRRSSVTALGKLGQAATLIRLEGFGPSVADRLSAIESQFGDGIEYRSLDAGAGAAIWREIRDVAPLIDPGHSVWRISLPAADSARTVAAIMQATPAEAFYDWGGGLVWLTLPSDAEAQLVRGLLPSGHATLMRAPVDIRAATAIFQPQPPALAALQGRVKAAFDPDGILSPGRMGEGG